MYKKCECSDSGCHAHPYKPICDQTGTTVLFRVDMEDHTGTLFCEDCAADAMELGYFSIESAEEIAIE
jgi:hypothetical protein